MKPWIIAGIVAVAFLGGILAGGGILGGNDVAKAPPVVATSTSASAPETPKVSLTPGGDRTSTTPPSTGPHATPGSSTERRPSATTEAFPSTETPPPAPPPPPPAALEEGKRAAAEDGADPINGGNGHVTHLVYDFKTEEERLAWEQRRRDGWAVRLAREREIKVRIMREKVGITPAQESQLVEILDEEGAERQRLVDAMADGSLSRTTFDEQVHANVTRAREKLAKLLTAEQLTAYDELAPREQVLREETH